MFSIGQFSRIAGLTVKTIRLYHEKGLLIPGWVDEKTGYRFYSERNLEQARAISYLRSMEFPLTEIKEILDHFAEDADVLVFLEKHRETIARKLEQLNTVALSLDEIIRKEKEAKTMLAENQFAVDEKELSDIEVVGLRWKGRYDETGKAFQQLGRLAGRHICGAGMNLYYDNEFKEEDADIESCFPIRSMKEPGALSLHRLPGGRCIFLVHKGPYEQLGRSYAKVMEYIQSKKYQMVMPIREVYLKGPGMIFRGNPKKQLTEIQIMIGDTREGNHEKIGA